MPEANICAGSRSALEFNVVAPNTGHQADLKTLGDKEMSRNERHVVPRDDGWAVVKPDSERASAVVNTQKQAIDRARDILKNDGGGELVIHRKDGGIRGSDTIPPANDPYPPPG